MSHGRVLVVRIAPIAAIAAERDVHRVIRCKLYCMVYWASTGGQLGGDSGRLGIKSLGVARMSTNLSTYRLSVHGAETDHSSL